MSRRPDLPQPNVNPPEPSQFRESILGWISLLHINTMPGAKSRYSGRYAPNLLASTCRTPANVLPSADVPGVQKISEGVRIGCLQIPLHKALYHAISNPRSPPNLRLLSHRKSADASPRRNETKAQGLQRQFHSHIWRVAKAINSIVATKQALFGA